MVKATGICAALGFALLWGCDADESDDAPDDTGAVTAGAEVELLRRLPMEVSGGIAEARRALLKEPGEFETLWKRATSHVTPAPRPPAVDFAKEMVAVLALGKKPTGGWSAEIVGARERGGRLVLLYAEHAPAEGAAVTEGVTAPWHAVVLARSDLPVEWQEYRAPAPPPRK